MQRRGGGGKAVPVAVGGGLAIGVFVGLLLIRGTGEAEAQDEEGTEVAAVDAGVVAPDAAAVAATTPDAAPAAPPDAAPVTSATLRFAVDSSVDGLELTVDGKPVSGDSYEVELGDKDKLQVTVKASAPGYHTFRDKVTVAAGDSPTIDVKLRQRHRPSGDHHGGSNNNHHGGTRPGGIIDL